MFDFAAPLRSLLDPRAAAWLDEARQRAEGRPAELPVLFPQLARQLGRRALASRPELVEQDGALFDLCAWRSCDAGAAQLVAASAVGPELLVDLYRHGDMEERISVLRCVQLRPIDAASLVLLGEVQRTNTALHFEAGALDSDFVVRALRHGGEDSGFTRADFANLVLKCAFLDLPAARLLGAFDEARPELSAMLQDFATEREAAGRKVWVDSYRFLGRAPCPGAMARLAGALEHGSDAVRRSAALGAVEGGRTELAPFAAERAPREPLADIRALLERLTS